MEKNSAFPESSPYYDGPYPEHKLSPGERPSLKENQPVGKYADPTPGSTPVPFTSLDDWHYILTELDNGFAGEYPELTRVCDEIYQFLRG